MHRVLVRHPRFPQPSSTLRQPQLVLIQGGKLQDDPLLILLAALFLLELRSLVEKSRQRRSPSESDADEASEPVEFTAFERDADVTGVHPVLDEAALDRMLAEAPLPIARKNAKQSKPRIWTVTEEAAGHFARCVLGSKLDLDDFLNKRAEKVMNLRLRSRQKFKPYRQVRELEWLALQEHVRTIVDAMLPTNRHTSEGYQIRRQPPQGDEAPLEAVVCLRSKQIIRLYRTARPRRQRPRMVRMRPHHYRTSRS